MEMEIGFDDALRDGVAFDATVVESAEIDEGFADRDLLRWALLSLPPREERVVRLYFGVGGIVPLTLREFDLLHFLVRHPGQAFGRSELLARVWGAGFDGYEHTVNSHINRLRSKVEADPREPLCIVTVWGVGYRFDPPAGTPP